MLWLLRLSLSNFLKLGRLISLHLDRCISNRHSTFKANLICFQSFYSIRCFIIYSLFLLRNLLLKFYLRFDLLLVRFLFAHDIKRRTSFLPSPHCIWQFDLKTRILRTLTSQSRLLSQCCTVSLHLLWSNVLFIGLIVV